MNFSLRTLLIVVPLVSIAGAMIYTKAFPPPRAVVVATADLPPFTQLTLDNTQVEKWPAKLVPVDWASQQSEIVGKYLRYRAASNLPIFNHQVMESVNELWPSPAPKTNVVTVQWGTQDHEDISGGGPPNGTVVDISQIIDGQEKLIAGDVKVVRNYEFSSQDYPHAIWLLGVELTDKQTIDYIKAKRAGKIRIRTVSLNAE